MIPDDTAGRPLTPGEKAAIADLERRLLLETRAPVRNLAVGRPAPSGHSGRRRSRTSTDVVGPLIALLASACALVGLLAAIGAGPLGAAAVLVAVVATALVWMLLPARFGGPARPYRSRRRPPWRSH